MLHTQEWRAQRNYHQHYSVGLALTEREIEEAQRLRYRVFADELGARIHARTPGVDADFYDPHCEHLIVRDEQMGKVVGTYRILTPQAAHKVGSYYTENEFDLTRLQHLRSGMVEVGRSCIHPDYRNGAVIALLWGKLAEFMERSKELRESVKSALIYPTILLFVAIASVVILLAVVVPQFEPIFEQSGKALPWVTEMVLGAGAFMRAYWSGLVLVAVAAAFLASRRLRSPEAKLAWDRRVLALPLVGDLAAKVETARLARTLGTLLRNGVALVSALSIARETLTNTWMAAGLAEVGRELKTGRGFAKPMMETRRYPAFAVHMIQVGEETGRLDQMLLDVAEVYDAEVARAVKRALALLEPAMILFLTLVVGGVILSILAAMLSIYDLPL